MSRLTTAVDRVAQFVRTASRRVREDVRAAVTRDPAARSVLAVVTYPGLHAVWLHRITSRLWAEGFCTTARFVSQLGRAVTGVEIHPGARIGRRFFIDHGTGVVIGETAVVGDDVTSYHGVTLGATESTRGKRHPTVRSGVTLGANAIMLGDVTVGRDAVVAAGAVVTSDVPPGVTVAGNPAEPLDSSDEAAGNDSTTPDEPSRPASNDGLSLLPPC